MLHLVNASEFDTVTFELDGDTHFPARIPPADILAATPDPARRRCGSNLINRRARRFAQTQAPVPCPQILGAEHDQRLPSSLADRKSTRLNSSHGYISYAVFCLKK